jgi:hypothetical protein
LISIFSLCNALMKLGLETENCTFMFTFICVVDGGGKSSNNIDKRQLILTTVGAEVEISSNLLTHSNFMLQLAYPMVAR